MWSGKTTELLRRYDRKVLAKVPCLLVKHCSDTRYDHEDHIVTHVNTYGLHSKGQASIYDTISNLIIGEKLYSDNGRNIDTIFIDEIQFFSDKHLCLDLLNIGINVVVAGLNGDFKRHMFPGMDALFASAYDIQMLTAVCSKCYKDACHTARITHKNRSQPQYQQLQVGGSDMYQAVCLRCYQSLHQPNI